MTQNGLTVTAHGFILLRRTLSDVFMPRLPERLPLAWVVLLCAGLTGCPDSSGGGPRTDSNTNWMTVCTSGVDCDPGLACLCGVCTAPCATRDACEALGDGNCEQSGDGAWESQCGGDPSAPAGICLLRCSDLLPCPDGQLCYDGTCGPETPRDPDDLCEDAQAPDAGADASSVPDAGPEPDAEVPPTDTITVPDGCPQGDAPICGLAIGRSAAEVYTCEGDGSYVLQDLCPGSCTSVGGSSDVCDSGAGCFEGEGFYCGSAFDLPADVLFHCSAAGIFVASPCIAGCQLVPEGPDRCNQP